MRTLVYGRSLLTGRLEEPEITGGGVVIDGTTIAAVGKAADLRRAHAPGREIGGNDRVVLPGLASAHQHGGGVSSVQLGCPDQPFERWMIQMLGVPPLDAYLDTLYHAVRLIENGITTTIHSHYTRDPLRYDDEVEGHLRAWGQSRMRVAFAPCFLDNNQFTYESNAGFLASLPVDLAATAGRLRDLGPHMDNYLDLVADLRKRANGSDHARVLLGPVAPQWCTRASLERLAAEGDPARGTHTHLLESPAQRRYLDAWPGGSVLDWLDQFGFVGPAASFAHGIWLRPAEIELLADRGASVVHNPGSNLRVQNGIAPLGELRRAGVPVALGTDEMTLNDDDDLLAEARLARTLANLRGADLTAADVLNMATHRGAVASRFGELTGMLAPGMRADVVLVDAARLEEPAVTADVTMLDLVIGRGRGSDVRTVMIDGEIVLDEGTHTWIDRTELVAELRAVAGQHDRDQGRRQIGAVANRLARAYDEYPKRVYDPLKR